LIPSNQNAAPPPPVIGTAKKNRFMDLIPAKTPKVPQTVNTAAKSQPPMTAGDTAIDAAKSFGTGVGEGVIGLVGLPRDVADLAQTGLEYVAPKLGLDGKRVGEIFSKINPTSYLPSSGEIRGDIERNMTGEFYQPRSTIGEYANTTGEFAASALAGPGGAVRKAAMTVIPAIVTETAGQMVKGSDAEPYVRAGAAIASGGLAAGFKRPTTNKILREASKTSKVMQEAKNIAYKQAEETVGKQQISTKEFAGIVRAMNKEAVAKGVGGALSETTDKLYSNSKSIISDMSKILQGVARGERPPPTYIELENFRQTLSDVVEDSKDLAGKMSKDGYLASKFIDHIDDGFSTTQFREARNTFKTLRKTQRLERAIAEAETRSSSTDLAYKNEFKKIVRENLKRPLFSPSEMEAIRQVSGTGRINNLLEGLGRGGFSSKSVTAGSVTTGLASMLSPLAGIDPLTGAALSAAATTGAKKLGTKLTKDAAERARNIVSQGGENTKLDAKMATAGRDRRMRRAIAVENARKQSESESSSSKPWPSGAVFMDAKGNFYGSNGRLIQAPN
jgi:hypothetical protein